MTISRSAWRGEKRGNSAPKRSMSYGDMESDMYSMAQHAVAKGYGKIEYLRAQPIALSSRVSTTASPRSACSPDVASRGFGGAMRLATSTFVYPATTGLSKPVCNRQG